MDAEAAGKKTFVVDGKSHPVQMAGSPYHKHGKIQKKIEKARRKDGDNPDFYETYSHLYEAKAKAEAAHNSERRESDDAQVREDEDAARGAAMEMAPLKKNASPLDRGGYVGGADVDGGDYVRTAGAYQDMFNKLEGATKNFIAGQENPDYEGKSERQKARVAKREKRGVRKGEGTINEATGEYTATDAGSKFNKKTDLIDAKSITNKAFADKQKEENKNEQLYNRFAKLTKEQRQLLEGIDPTKDKENA